MICGPGLVVEVAVDAAMISWSHTMKTSSEDTENHGQNLKEKQVEDQAIFQLMRCYGIVQ